MSGDLTGSTLGAYRILAKLGEGGMGVVYRARDERLERDVALKVLPDSLQADPERLARFEREAKLLAQLNHPNIAQIHGLEASGDSRALVLELVEGPTLAERLAEGPLPAREALSCALQIALALEEAHERGIVHRDLKPQNVKASVEGKVKVLDFGLAKAMDPLGAASGGSGSASQLAQSPTLTLGATVQGVILGTAAYMAPEQAKGLAVDKRVDIWAFGVVLYEILTGRRLFSGDSVTDTLADVLRREIDLSALPAETPPAIRRLLRRCLERNPKNRLHDIGDARLVLAEVQGGAVEADGVAAPAANPRRRLGLTAALVATAALSALLAAWVARRAAPAPLDRAIVRTSVLAPPTLLRAPLAGSYALAPAGDAVVFVAPDQERRPILWVRELADPVARPLAGTEGARLFPFWSPDGREIGYFSDEGLRRVPRGGGASRSICAAADARGGAWGPDGTILFAPDPFSPLMKVAASGGTPVAATSFDEGAGDSSHRFPIFLPDGRRFLFAVGVANEALSFRIVAGSLDRAGERHELTESAFAPRFAAPRHLIYGRDEATLVRELDLDRLELVGEPRLLAETPDTSVYVLGTPPVDVASTGAMVYAALDGRPTEFVELGASGDPVASLREGGDFLVVAPSRGGRIAALRAAGAGQSLWVVDPTRATATRLTAAGRSHNGAAWSADGRELAAFLTSGGGTKLVWLDAESGRERELLDTGGRWILPIDASRDGRYLLAGETTAAQRLNLVYLRLDAAPVLTPYLESPAEESTGALSPDARWIAYVSDASGRAEAYVDRFPEPAGARRVAVSGEVQRVFWPRQDELVFLTSDGDRRTAYASRVTFEPDLRVEPPRRRLDFAGELRGLTVGEDGRFRFGRAVGERPPALTLVQGWTRQLEAAP